MAINTTFVSGAILTAAQMNALPFGLSSTVTSTSVQSVGGGALQDITSLTSTITLINGRSYLAIATISCGVPASGTSNLSFKVIFGAGSTELQTICLPSGNTGSTNFNGQFYFVATASASTIVKVQGTAISQACSLTGTTNLHRLTILDVGIA